MAYNKNLAHRVREYLARFHKLKVEEKTMFRGLTFMVNGKMCVSVSGDNLMCRFDPLLQEDVSEKHGFQTMIMKGKELKGYCYVTPAEFKADKDFEFWINLCLTFNNKAKSSKKLTNK